MLPTTPQSILSQVMGAVGEGCKICGDPGNQVPLSPIPPPYTPSLLLYGLWQEWERPNLGLWLSGGGAPPWHPGHQGDDIGAAAASLPRVAKVPRCLLCLACQVGWATVCRLPNGQTEAEAAAAWLAHLALPPSKGLLQGSKFSSGGASGPRVPADRGGSLQEGGCKSIQAAPQHYCCQASHSGSECALLLLLTQLT